jgi:hypothetical protein
MLRVEIGHTVQHSRTVCKRHQSSPDVRVAPRPL